MNKPQPKRSLVPLLEVREILGGISRRQFYNLKNEGQLETVKMGKRTFVRMSEIERFVDSLPSSPSMQVMKSAR